MLTYQARSENTRVLPYHKDNISRLAQKAQWELLTVVKRLGSRTLRFKERDVFTVASPLLPALWSWLEIESITCSHTCSFH